MSLVLALVGAAFMLTAALGTLRWPDTYVRLHSAGKSASLGILCLLAAAALASGDVWVALRCSVAGLFFLVTAPVGCHALARVLWRSSAARPEVVDPLPDGPGDGATGG